MDILLANLADEPGEFIESGSRLRRQVACDRLKDAIRHATLEAGQLLSETKLFSPLVISWIPVREALRKLARKGLVQVIPERAGSVVSLLPQAVYNVVHRRRGAARWMKMTIFAESCRF